MALSWSMDKLGPICRAVEDCALVLQAVYGPDHKDWTVHDIAFEWDPNLDIKKLRVGYVKEDFEKFPDIPAETKPEVKERMTKNRAITKAHNDATLDVLRNKLGITLIPIELPKMPWDAMLSMLIAESAAAFDDLTRSGRDALLNAQTKHDWPNTFRVGRFIPAVEYIQAGRARMMGMQKMAALFKQVDCFVAPTDSEQLIITNLTGHPAVILPNGFRPADAPEPPPDPFAGGGPGTPTSFTFVGDLYAEAKLLALAKAYQDATEWHLKHPAMEIKS